MECQDLPSEDDIRSYWIYNDKIYVSIVCITYNQSEYICDAIDSFLKQKTRYMFNIIIHDDCSNDKTQGILKKYKEKYPTLIEIILQKENQYSNGKKPSRIAISKSKAEYIALCEGDDYWVDEYKLDSQIEELEKNKKVKLCFTKAYILKNNKLLVKYDYGDKKRTISAEDFIKIGGGACATNSIVFSKSVLDCMPIWYDVAPVGDAFVQAYGAIPGGVIYLPKITSVYRVLSNGSWSSKSTLNLHSIYFNLNKLDEFYNLFNLDTNHSYAKYTKIMIGRKYLENFLLSLKRCDINSYTIKLLLKAMFKLKFRFIKVLFEIISDNFKSR